MLGAREIAQVTAAAATVVLNMVLNMGFGRWCRDRFQHEQFLLKRGSLQGLHQENTPQVLLGGE
jgi:hypothetical protein